jgi:hypothetical protein
MSRAYRIQVAETVTRTVRAEDGVCAPLTASRSPSTSRTRR